MRWAKRSERRQVAEEIEAGASPEELAAADELTALTEELGLYDR